MTDDAAAKRSDSISRGRKLLSAFHARRMESQRRAQSCDGSVAASEASFESPLEKARLEKGRVLAEARRRSKDGRKPSDPQQAAQSSGPPNGRGAASGSTDNGSADFAALLQEAQKQIEIGRQWEARSRQQDEYIATLQARLTSQEATATDYQNKYASLLAQYDALQEKLLLSPSIPIESSADKRVALLRRCEQLEIDNEQLQIRLQSQKNIAEEATQLLQKQQHEAAEKIAREVHRQTQDIREQLEPHCSELEKQLQAEHNKITRLQEELATIKKQSKSDDSQQTETTRKKIKEIEDAQKLLEQELREQKSAAEKLQTQLDEGRKAMASLQEQLRSATEDNARLRSTGDEATKAWQAKLSSQESHAGALEEARKLLEQELREQKSAAEKLQAQLDEGRKAMASLQEQLRSATEDNARLRSTGDEATKAWQAKLVSQESHAGELEEARKLLEQELREQKSAAEKLQAQLDEGRKAMASLQEQLRSATEDNARLRSTGDEATKAWQAKLSSQESAAEKLQTQLDEGRKAMASLQEQLRSATEDNARLRSTGDEATKTWQAKLASQESHAGELEEARKLLEQELREQKSAAEKLQAQLDEGRKAMASLQEQLRSATEDNARLRSTGDEATKAWQAKLSSQESAAEKLQTQLDEGRKAMASLQEQLRSATEDNARLRSTGDEATKAWQAKLVSQESHAGELEEARKLLEQELREQKSAAEKLQAQLDEGRKAMASLQEQLRSATEDNARLRSTGDEATKTWQAKLSSQESHAGAQEEARKLLEQELREQKSAAEKLQAQLDEGRKAMASLQVQLRSASEENTRLLSTGDEATKAWQAKLSSQESAAEKLQAQLDEGRKAMASLQEQLRSATEDNARLRSTGDEATKAWQAKLVSQESHAGELEEARKLLEQELREQKSAAEKLQAQLDEGRKAMASLQEQLRSATEDNARLRSTGDEATKTWQAKLSSQESHAGAQEEARKLLEQELREQKSAAEKLQAQLDEGRKAMASLQEQLRSATEDNARLRSTVDEATKAWQAKLVSQESAAEKLQTQLDEGRKAMASLQEQLRSATEDNARLRSTGDEATKAWQAKLSSQESAAEKLQTQLDEGRKAMASLQEQLRSATEDNARLRSTGDEATKAWQAKLVSQESHAGELEEARKLLEQELREQKSAAEKLQAQLDEGRKAMASLQEQLRSATEDNARLRSTGDEATKAWQAKLVSQESHAGALEEARKLLEEELREQKSAAEKLQAQLDEGRKAMASLQEQLRSAAEENTRLRSTGDEATKAWQAKLSSQESKSCKLQERLDAQEEARKLLQVKLDSAESALADATGSVVSLRLQLQTKSTEFAALDNAFRAFQTRMESELAKQASQSLELSRTQKELESEKSERAHLSLQLSALENSRAELTASLAARSDLLREVDTSRSRDDELHAQDLAQIQQQAIQLQQLDVSLDASRKAVAELTQANDSLHEESEKLLSRIEAGEQQCKRLSDLLAGHKAQQLQYKQELARKSAAASEMREQAAAATRSAQQAVSKCTWLERRVADLMHYCALSEWSQCVMNTLVEQWVAPLMLNAFQYVAQMDMQKCHVEGLCGVVLAESYDLTRSLSLQCRSHVAEIAETSEQRDTLLGLVKDYESSHNALSESHKAAVASFEEQMLEANAKNAILEQGLLAEQTRSHSLESDIGSAREALQSLQEHASKMKQQYDAQCSELQELYKKTTKDLHSELEGCNRTISEKVGEVLSLKNELLRANAEGAATKERHSLEIQQKESTIERVTKQLAQREEELGNVTRRMEAASSALRETQSHMADLEREVAKLSTALAAATEHEHELEQRLAQEHVALSRSEGRCIALSEDMEKMKAVLQQRGRDFDAYATNNDDQIKSLTQRMSQLNVQLSQASLRADDLDKELRQAQRDLQNTKLELEAACKCRDDSAQENARLSSALAEKCRSLTASEQALREKGALIEASEKRHQAELEAVRSGTQKDRDFKIAEMAALLDQERASSADARAAREAAARFVERLQKEIAQAQENNRRLTDNLLDMRREHQQSQRALNSIATRVAAGCEQLGISIEGGATASTPAFIDELLRRISRHTNAETDVLAETASLEELRSALQQHAELSGAVSSAIHTLRCAIRKTMERLRSEKASMPLSEYRIHKASLIHLEDQNVAIEKCVRSATSYRTVITSHADTIADLIRRVEIALAASRAPTIAAAEAIAYQKLFITAKCQSMLTRTAQHNESLAAVRKAYEEAEAALGRGRAGISSAPLVEGIESIMAMFTAADDYSCRPFLSGECVVDEPVVIGTVRGSSVQPDHGEELAVVVEDAEPGEEAEEAGRGDHSPSSSAGDLERKFYRVRKENQRLYHLVRTLQAHVKRLQQPVANRRSEDDEEAAMNLSPVAQLPARAVQRTCEVLHGEIQKSMAVLKNRSSALPPTGLAPDANVALAPPAAEVPLSAAPRDDDSEEEAEEGGDGSEQVVDLQLNYEEREESEEGEEDEGEDGNAASAAPPPPSSSAGGNGDAVSRPRVEWIDLEHAPGQPPPRR